LLTTRRSRGDYGDLPRGRGTDPAPLVALAGGNHDIRGDMRGCAHMCLEGYRVCTSPCIGAAPAALG